MNRKKGLSLGTGLIIIAVALIAFLNGKISDSTLSFILRELAFYLR